MRELRTAFRLALGIIGAVGWMFGTVWLGARAVWRLGILMSRWRDIFAESLMCPRGHATDAYGVFECRCGAIVEGWVFERCRVCGQNAGWTPCTTCNLPIRNPLNV